MWTEPAGGVVIRIPYAELIVHASESAITQMMHDEIVKQLTDDPDLRLLVREMVKDAIAKMGLQEVVGLAVREHLQGNKP